jgi:hypothetical protein
VFDDDGYERLAWKANGISARKWSEIGETLSSSEYRSKYVGRRHLFGFKRQMNTQRIRTGIQDDDCRRVPGR